MKRIRNVILFFGVILLSFLFLDSWLRITHISEVYYNDLYQDIGRGRRADHSYVFFREGFSFFKFNKYRYLGPAYSPMKDTSVLRLALLGDSFIEGFQVFDRNHFRSILEESLNKRGRHTEVLNFGRSGFNLSDMYIYDKLFVDQFIPDLVIYMICEEDLYAAQVDRLRPELVFINDSLIIQKEYPSRLLLLFRRSNFILQHSPMANMLLSCFKTTKEQRVLPILLDKFYLKIAKESIKEDDTHIFKPINIEILKKLDPDETVFINISEEPMDTTFLNSLSKNGFHLVELSPLLDSLNKTGINPYYWEATNTIGHWNCVAHKAVGDYMAKELNSFLK